MHHKEIVIALPSGGLQAPDEQPDTTETIEFTHPVSGITLQYEYTPREFGYLNKGGCNEQQLAAPAPRLCYLLNDSQLKTVPTMIRLPQGDFILREICRGGWTAYGTLTAGYNFAFQEARSQSLDSVSANELEHMYVDDLLLVRKITLPFANKRPPPVAFRKLSTSSSEEDLREIVRRSQEPKAQFLGNFIRTGTGRDGIEDYPSQIIGYRNWKLEAGTLRQGLVELMARESEVYCVETEDIQSVDSRLIDLAVNQQGNLFPRTAASYVVCRES